MHEMSCCAPKCLVTGQTQYDFLLAFNLNIYQKARKIVYFRRNCTFLFQLCCRIHQEGILAKFGMFLVGFSEALTLVWRWPTMGEREYSENLSKLGGSWKENRIYHAQTCFSLRVIVH